MRKFTILLAFILVATASCKKSNLADCSQPDKFSLTDAVVVSKGDLVFASSPKQNGLAKIYRQKNGKYVLGLEQINLSSTTDLSAYFSSTSDLSSNALKLFSFKSIDGQMYYELPVTLNIGTASFLLIQGDISQQPAGIAELKQ